MWSYRAAPADRTVQGVCRECNNNWLNDIEGVAKPHLLPTLQSRSRELPLSETAQGALAIWAFKTGLVVGVKGGSAKIPVEYLHDFYESRQPTPSTRIWIVATTRRDMLFIDHRTITVHRSDDDPPPSSNAFSTLLGVGHVGFYVLNWTSAVKPTMRQFYERPYADLLIPIFPSRGRVVWPPRKAFTKEGFDQFGDVFGRLDGKPPVI